MQIHILVNIIEKVESRHKSVLSSKYYITINTTFSIFHIFFRITCILWIFELSLIITHCIFQTQEYVKLEIKDKVVKNG